MNYRLHTSFKIQKYDVYLISYQPWEAGNYRYWLKKIMQAWDSCTPGKKLQLKLILCKFNPPSDSGCFFTTFSPWNISQSHWPPPALQLQVSSNFLVFHGLWLLMSRGALWPCRATHILGPERDAKGWGSEKCKQRCGRKDRELGGQM